MKFLLEYKRHGHKRWERLHEEHTIHGEMIKTMKAHALDHQLAGETVDVAALSKLEPMAEFRTRYCSYRYRVIPG